MRMLILVSVLASVFLSAATAQPLSGTYTVGGSSPDFATPQDAATALKLNGVSGPVFINIRPGTYVRQGTPGPVIRLDTVVVGTSTTNRITFQPDIAAGGNPNNVILQIDCDVNTDYNNDREIVYLGADYTTFHNMTFEDVDSLDSPARFLLRVRPVVFANPTIEGLVVNGCTFIGTPYYTHGQQFGTDFGVTSGGGLTTATITNNQFTNLMRAASFNIDSAPSGDSLVIEDNRFDHLYGGSTGSGNPLGTAIEMICAHPSVRRNFVSQSVGSIGTHVVGPVAGTIDRNYVQGGFRNGQIIIDPSSGVVTDSLMVSNNVMLGQGVFAVRTGNTRVFHNTIIHSDPFGTPGMEIIGAHSRVINNILLVSSGFVAYTQFGAVDLISDYNLFFTTASNLARDPTGQYYTTLASYQAATGMDTNSHFSNVSFESDSLGIHLDECEAQNSALDGIRLAEVPVDYYGAIRDSARPFIGAVEGVRLPYNMFAAPFKSGLPGFAVSIDQGKFDNPSTPGIAVPDYDNNQVLLFHNNGSSRSFTQTGALPVGFQPALVKFFDLDHDNKLDLIVGGEASLLKIFWGNGLGGFPTDTTIATHGRVRSLDTGTVSVFNLRTIFLTEDNGFLPSTSFLAYVQNDAGRTIFASRVVKPRPGGGTEVDTIPAVLSDIAVGDLDGNGTQEVVAPSIGLPPNNLFVFVDTSFGNIPLGSRHVYSFPTSNLTATSSIIMGDFDGDLDRDLVATGISDDFCVFLRNQGNLNFISDTITTTSARGLAALDYENDGDLDFVTINSTLDSLGVTVFLNDGTGHFTEKRNCYFPFASGTPNGIVATDFDLDGKTDIAVVSRSIGGGDSLFVLYNLGGFNGTTRVEEPRTSETPHAFTLFQNYPNPFNPSTRIEYTLPSQSHVTIKIYNVLGQEIATLVNEQQLNGTHVVEWNGKSSTGMQVSSGVYFYRVEARQLGGQFLFASVKKMVLLK